MNARKVMAMKNQALEHMAGAFTACEMGLGEKDGAQFHLNTAFSLHCDCCAEIAIMSDRGDLFDDDDPLAKAIELLDEAAKDRPELKYSLAGIISQLNELPLEGGAS